MSTTRFSRELEERLRDAAEPAREVIMTALEELVEKGRVEGRVEAGCALLERQLRVRFGPLDDATRERLRRATPDEHAAWAERLLAASSLAEVFGPST